MVAVRPTFHNPALLAKQAANIDRIRNGRLTLNVVSSWWADEAKKYGIPFDEHDDRYARTSEWLDVLTNCWSQQHTTHNGRYYTIDDNILSPKPHPTRTYSGIHPRPSLVRARAWRASCPTALHSPHPLRRRRIRNRQEPNRRQVRRLPHARRRPHHHRHQNRRHETTPRPTPPPPRA